MKEDDVDISSLIESVERELTEYREYLSDRLLIEDIDKSSLIDLIKSPILLGDEYRDDSYISEVLSRILIYQRVDKDIIKSIEEYRSEYKGIINGHLSRNFRYEPSRPGLLGFLKIIGRGFLIDDDNLLLYAYFPTEYDSTVDESINRRVWTTSLLSIRGSLTVSVYNAIIIPVSNVISILDSGEVIFRGNPIIKEDNKYMVWRNGGKK